MSSDKDIPLNITEKDLKFLSNLANFLINSSLDILSENGKAIVICGAIRLTNGSYLFLNSCSLSIFLNLEKLKCHVFLYLHT